ncbi:MAG: universal stress protein [Deltaproteobacteria bacterium]|nr:universal stress protein [Deltaproteobacteria bacterium]
MKILFAADEQPYSAYALREVTRLALNTWADVTIVGVIASGVPDPDAESDQPLLAALQRYREDFLEGAVSEGLAPYALGNYRYEWVPLRGGRWEEMLVARGAKKDLKVMLRNGAAAQEILTEARDEESDLIVLGCAKGEQCLWGDRSTTPQRVVNDADCSVLLVKEEQPITKIVACLDQSYISQDSLEMINQVATIHGAQLELIGLSGGGGLKKDVYRRLIEIGDYYEDRQIQVATRLTEVAEFENTVARELPQDLLALWMGKKSLLDRFFPRDWVGRFVGKCPSSVLVMR